MDGAHRSDASSGCSRVLLGAIGGRQIKHYPRSVQYAIADHSWKYCGDADAVDGMNNVSGVQSGVGSRQVDGTGDHDDTGGDSEIRNGGTILSTACEPL